jgi:hypothetical protein
MAENKYTAGHGPVAAVDNVVRPAAFAKEPVQNPPMKKGPKPKGTVSLYGARRRRERAKWLLRRAAPERRAAEQEREVVLHALSNMVPHLHALVRLIERLADTPPD